MKTCTARRLVYGPFALAVLASSGCAPTGLVVRGELPPCAGVQTIAVDELAHHTTCSLVGWTVRFPDGQTYDLSSANGASSSSALPGVEWGGTMWGGYGSVAWLRTPDGLTLWGPPEAVNQQVLLFSRDVD
ncbi:hypothetical protein [Pengzhenrongella sicca]|uniref:Uncharacterized protein n=1 Tax=Pengzhenrongella sicca TaxID=2819238 RepID=A0A8A4ZC44_9MICO|nr:hypothetical protein [Pengzhenrongella sicca]QTE28965.1 hypothetical protein J4E96_16845 [Pengzhenrongella sicca]